MVPVPTGTIAGVARIRDDRQTLRMRIRIAAALAVLALSSFVAAGPAAATTRAADFPARDSRYHTYAEMVAELDQVVADHPKIVEKVSIGKSYQGRDIWAAKISDNVATDRKSVV